MYEAEVQQNERFYLEASFSQPHREVSDESTGLKGACPGEEVEGQLYIGALLPEISLFPVLSSYAKSPICLPGTVDKFVRCT